MNLMLILLKCVSNCNAAFFFNNLRILLDELPLIDNELKTLSCEAILHAR